MVCFHHLWRQSAGRLSHVASLAEPAATPLAALSVLPAPGSPRPAVYRATAAVAFTAGLSTSHQVRALGSFFLNCTSPPT